MAAGSSGGGLGPCARSEDPGGGMAAGSSGGGLGPCANIGLEKPYDAAPAKSTRAIKQKIVARRAEELSIVFIKSPKAENLVSTPVKIELRSTPYLS